MHAIHAHWEEARLRARPVCVVADGRVLEVSGAAPCKRWLVGGRAHPWVDYFGEQARVANKGRVLPARVPCAPPPPNFQFGVVLTIAAPSA